MKVERELDIESILAYRKRWDKLEKKQEAH